MTAEYHGVVWNSANVKGEVVANDIYCYRIEAGTFSELN